MTAGQQYQDGQIVNGHRYNAIANAWEPLPQQPVDPGHDASRAPVTTPGGTLSGTGVPLPAPAPAPAPAPPAPVLAPSGNGLATAGFVLGLLGFLGSWIPLINVVGIILAVIGVILAAVGLAKSRKVGSGKALAIAGLILGGLAIVVAIVINVAFAHSVDSAVHQTTATDVKAPTGSPGGATSGSDVGATREKPAPIGSAITGDDWTVKVNSVTTVTKDSLGQKPKAGKTLLLINMTATYNGNNPQGETAWATVKYVTADGSTIDVTDGFFIADEGFDSLKTLFGGASMTGNKILEVPSNWQDGVLAVKPGLLSDAVFVAVK
jgi:hypothetical protein